MIRAYNEDYLEICQDKLGSMFELAFYKYNLSVDQFMNKFLHSSICAAFEKADPIYVSGKSANELIALVLNKKPKYVEQSMFASPEYWLGYVLAYVQWYTAMPFKIIDKYYSCSRLLNDYSLYHEMDISKILSKIIRYLPKEKTLKDYRKENNLTQKELAVLTNISLRSIKAYEQGKLELSKASGESLYNLAKTLNCSIENLIFPKVIDDKTNKL